MSMELAYYVISGIFIAVFVIEALVTGSVLMHQEHLDGRMSSGLKWWAIISMMMISASNLLGLLWLQHNYDVYRQLDQGNWVQAIFALATASLFCWVLVFHFKLLKPQIEARRAEKNK